MMFRVSVPKAIQAIGVVFRSDGATRMNYMRLLKLLYIADRESLRETGRPIVGGPVVAMPRGPVLEEIYDLIRGRHAEMPSWGRHYRTARFELVQVEEPDVKKLSRYEIAKLQEVAKRHEDDDEWDLSNLTHGFDEWKQNDPGASSRPIPLRHILSAVGHDPGAVEQIEVEAEDQARFDHLFQG